MVLWHINHCRLFNAKSSLYIYIKYIGFGLVGFYGISTIVGYLMPNPLYTYILNIYMIWFGWVLWHINHYRLFNAKFKLTKEGSRKYPAKTITDADYADDITLLANTPTQAETQLHSLERVPCGHWLPCQCTQNGRLKHIYSVLCALTWKPMPAETRSRLCSRVLAWAGVFARCVMSSA